MTILVPNLSMTVNEDTGDVEGIVGVNGREKKVREGLVKGSAVVILRYVAAPTYSTFDTSSFRQIFQTQFTGLCAVRAVYETDSASGGTIDNTAFAAGRAFANDDPVARDGTPAVWQVKTATSVGVASASFATDGAYGQGKTPWVLLDIPAPTDGGIGGYIYVGTKLASGTQKGIVGNGSRPTNDWESTISGLFPSMKYRALHKSGSDFVTTNQNGMGAASPTKLSQFNPVVYLEIQPIARYFSGAVFGDSTIQALGTGTPATQPYNYNPGHIAANLLQDSRSVPVVVSNFGCEGKTSAFYLKRLELLLADDDFRPDFVLIQPFSVNDSTFDQTLVDAGILKSLQLASTARKKGIQPIFTTVIPASATNSTTDAVRRNGNASILRSGELVLDRESLVTDSAVPARIQSALTYDGTHLNITGNVLCGTELSRIIRKLM